MIVSLGSLNLNTVNKGSFYRSAHILFNALICKVSGPGLGTEDHLLDSIIDDVIVVTAQVRQSTLASVR